MEQAGYLAAWIATLRALFHLLTVFSAFFWLKFADMRDGHLDAPSLHHRTYLRMLMASSLVACLSLAVSILLALYSNQRIAMLP